MPPAAARAPGSRCSPSPGAVSADENSNQSSLSDVYQLKVDSSPNSSPSPQQSESMSPAHTSDFRTDDSQPPTLGQETLEGGRWGAGLGGEGRRWGAGCGAGPAGAVAWPVGAQSAAGSGRGRGVWCLLLGACPPGLVGSRALPGSAVPLTPLLSPEPSLPSSEVADEPPTLTKEEPVPLETQVRAGGLKPCLTRHGPGLAPCRGATATAGRALQPQGAPQELRSPPELSPGSVGVRRRDVEVGSGSDSNRCHGLSLLVLGVAHRWRPRAVPAA